MNVDMFLSELRLQYARWGSSSIQPIRDQFRNLLETVQGMTTANVLQLLNLAVQCLQHNEVYLEVGSYLGATLIGAALGNHRQCIGVDNFSQFNETGRNKETLLENIMKWRCGNAKIVEA